MFLSDIHPVVAGLVPVYILMKDRLLLNQLANVVKLWNAVQVGNDKQGSLFSIGST